MVHLFVLALPLCCTRKQLVAIQKTLPITGVSGKKVLSQHRFQAQVASSLILVKTDRKRGKLSESPVPLSKRKVSNLPCADVRKNKFAHWPKKSDK